jgi:Tol biopolymer transport system component
MKICGYRRESKMKQLKLIRWSIVVLICCIVLIIPSGGLSNGRIAFCKIDEAGHPQILSIWPDGSGSAYLSGYSSYPVWSPDGKKIAYVDLSSSSNTNIYVMDLDGSNKIKISDVALNSRPSWAPDSDQIAYLGRNSLIVKTYPSRSDVTNIVLGRYVSDVTWSPDGEHFLYSKTLENSDFTPNGNPDIYMMDADMDGSNKIDITNDPGTDSSPAWSPDGSKIAFMSDREGKRAIYVMNYPLDSVSPTRLTDGTAEDDDPAWSPDGEKIIYTHWLGAGSNVALYIMDKDGSNPTPVTNPYGNYYSYNSPAWGLFISPVAITYPSGGENFSVGFPGGFYWDSKFVDEPLTVKLMQDKKVIQTWNDKSSPSGEEAFTVPGKWGVGSNFRFCIQGTKHTQFQSCNGTFNITNPINVTSLDNDEYWPEGSLQHITWEARTCPPSSPLVDCLPENSQVDIRVMDSNGKTIKDLDTYELGTRDTLSYQYTWKEVDIPTGTGYKINISSLILPGVYDISDRTFSVMEKPAFCIHWNGREICFDPVKIFPPLIPPALLIIGFLGALFYIRRTMSH